MITPPRTVKIAITGMLYVTVTTSLKMIIVLYCSSVVKWGIAEDLNAQDLLLVRVHPPLFTRLNLDNKPSSHNRGAATCA